MQTYINTANEPIDKFGLALIGNQLFSTDAYGLPPIPVDYIVPHISNHNEQARRTLLNFAEDPHFIGARIIHLWQILQHSNYVNRWNQKRQTLPLDDTSGLYTYSIIKSVTPMGIQPANTHVSLLGEFPKLDDGRRLTWTLQAIFGTRQLQLLDYNTGRESQWSWSDEPSYKDFPILDTGLILRCTATSGDTDNFDNSTWRIDIQKPYYGNVINILTKLRLAPMSSNLIFNGRTELFDVFKNGANPVDAIAAYLVAYLESFYE